MISMDLGLDSFTFILHSNDSLAVGWDELFTAVVPSIELLTLLRTLDALPLMILARVCSVYSLQYSNMAIELYVY